MGITKIDPLKYGLIFERFLNPERVSAPDFDIDFCQARREEVINYVKQKYGREKVAKIITFGSLGAKTVIRDIGRALEIPFNECDRLSKMIPEEPKITLKKSLAANPEFKKAYETEETCKRILDFGFVLEGLYRNPGTHAAGVVIGETELTEIIPLTLDKEKEPVTQYTKEPLEEIGLLKMDFLGLKTLTVIQEAIDLIKETRNIEIDINNLPLDNKPAFDLLNRGDTIGVFQLESAGMRDLFRRINITDIEDIFALIALYRPGPMNMLPDYIARKSGEAKTHYDHPLLESILEETHGVMIYQEQVQRAANILAGYSLGEADLLRRAMGKKKASEMEKQRDKFIKGAKTTNNITEKLSGKIFDTIAKFAGYGFNKAHSAGYGIISYQTAYLKANYPEEFMAALTSSEIGNFDKIPIFINETEEMGLKVLPPDVNLSYTRFYPEKNAVRYGLAGTKNVGAGATAAIIAERKANGPFTGLINFCERIDSQYASKKTLESLIRSGAMDSFGPHRGRLFNAIDFALARAAEKQRDRKSGQGNLFDMLVPQDADTGEEELPDCEEWQESELLKAEKELLGVYMSGHPLTRYSSLLTRYQQSTIQGAQDLEIGTKTRIGGIITSIRKLFTKASKEPMASIQIEDLDGSMEVMVFSESYAKYGMLLDDDAAILICGEIGVRNNMPQLTANEIYPLADAPKYFAQQVRIHIPVTYAEQGKMEKIKDIVRVHPGTTPLIICLIFPAGEKAFIEAGAGFTVCADESMIKEIEHELGENSVYVTVNPNAYRFNHDKRRFRSKKQQ
jgi:DNA polymerase-3 subunit alpha